MEHLQNCENHCNKSGEVSGKLESQNDVISYEIGNNLLSIKAQKNSRHIEDLNGFDGGKKCSEGDSKVNVIPHRPPQAKKVEEAMFLLSTTKYTDLQGSLQIEFKAPRNCIPLLKSSPSPPTSGSEMGAKENEKTGADVAKTSKEKSSEAKKEKNKKKK